MERMTALYTEEVEADLNSYPEIPSARVPGYKTFTEHKLKMFGIGMDTFASRSYARLSFDKYVWTNKISDETALNLTKNQPSLIALGAVEMSPNSPIGIKGTKRAPGTRRLVNSIKNLGHSDVMYVNEDYTSQTCANCHRKFPKHTRSHRFKVCVKCPRNAVYPQTKYPRLLVTKKSKRL